MPSENSQIEKCSVTGLPICRRMFNINLALGYAEEFYSLKALSEMHGQGMEEMFEFGLDYVEARECFRKEWAKMKGPDECPLKEDCAFELCFEDA